MEPLDLRKHPPRSCYVELDGLMLMPRTIDKLRAYLPGGNPGVYFINTKVTGISAYLLTRLGVAEADLLEAVRVAESEDAVAQWLRARTDAAAYPAINATLRRLKLKHSEDEAFVRAGYAEVLAAQPELEVIVDIIEADDRRMFP